MYVRRACLTEQASTLDGLHFSMAPNHGSAVSSPCTVKGVGSRSPTDVHSFFSLAVEREVELRRTPYPFTRKCLIFLAKKQGDSVPVRGPPGPARTAPETRRPGAPHGRCPALGCTAAPPSRPSSGWTETGQSVSCSRHRLPGRQRFVDKVYRLASLCSPLTQRGDASVAGRASAVGRRCCGRAAGPSEPAWLASPGFGQAEGRLAWPTSLGSPEALWRRGRRRWGRRKRSGGEKSWLFERATTENL